jgi:hypothetical protein
LRSPFSPFSPMASAATAFEQPQQMRRAASASELDMLSCFQDSDSDEGPAPQPARKASTSLLPLDAEQLQQTNGQQHDTEPVRMESGPVPQLSTQTLNEPAPAESEITRAQDLTPMERVNRSLLRGQAQVNPPCGCNLDEETLRVVKQGMKPASGAEDRSAHNGAESEIEEEREDSERVNDGSGDVRVGADIDVDEPLVIDLHKTAGAKHELIEPSVAYSERMQKSHQA